MKTILIMEDNAHQSRLMRRLLEHAGYTVLEAADGESGLRTAMAAVPDLILLDMGLPDLDGQTVVGLLKGSTLLSQTPVVAVTAWPEDYAAAMATAYGCDGYLSKPISAHLFAEQVGAYLAPTAGES
ncbi:MAG: response regulator [Anaerolineae bacterium]|jgi:two-component system cell cycle response regulator DivK|nr:response regulator [Anaerolineae bacterium]